MKTETLTKKIVRGVVSVFLSFVLSLSLVLLGILPVLHTLSSSAAWSRIAADSGYAQKMEEKLLEKFSFLSESSGVPASVCSAFLKEQLTSDAALAPVMGMFFETEQFDREAMTEAFCRKVEEYAVSLQESGELKLSEEEWAEMKGDFPTLAKYYIDEMSSAVNMSGIFSTLGGALRLVQKLVLPIAVIGGLFAVFSMALLLLIHKKKVLFYSYLGFFSAGLLLTVPAVWLKLGNYVARLGVEPLHLKEMIVSLANVLIQKLMTFGIVFLAVGLVCGVLAVIFRGKTSSQIREEKENDPNPSEGNA